MIDPQETLTRARDALVHAKNGAKKKVSARLLVRLEQKVRLTESALATERPPARAGATEDGLREVLARAEARADGRARSPHEARALEARRSRIAHIEGAESAGAEKLASLLETLAKDSARVLAAAGVEERAEPPAAPPKERGKRKKAPPEKRAPRAAAAAKAKAKTKSARTR